MTRWRSCLSIVAGVVALAVFATASGGCTDNPYKAETWTKQLGDSREAERAITELDQLGDPSAIEPIGNAWLTQGRPVRWLQVIIALARPLTADQATKGFFRDYETSGRPASWDKAVPFLKKAVSDVDETNPRSVDSATKAAEALGESKNPDGLDALVELAQKKPTKKLLVAQVAAIRAIGKYTTDGARAGTALTRIVERELPPNPRQVKEKDQSRNVADNYDLGLKTMRAAINALGDLHVAAAAKPLVLAMFRAPELLPFIRRSLVASGPTAADELRKVLAGTQPEVNQLAKDKRLETYCGDRNDTTECLPVSALIAYPAIVIGDFYDTKAVPELLAQLAKPATPVLYIDDQPSPNTQYDAIFGALRKIGSAEGAATIRAMWMGKAPAAESAAARPAKGGKRGAEPARASGASDLTTRVMAIDTYPFVSRDDAGTDDLGKIAADNFADASLRQGAATAFARLAHSTQDITVLQGLAQKYADESAKKRAEADGKPKAAFDAAEKDYEKAKAAHALAIKQPTGTTTDEVKASVKKAEAALAEATKTHDTAVEPYRAADAQAKLNKGFQRMFQTHIAQIEVAMRCKQNLDCYAATLKETPADAAKHNAAYIKDIAKWEADEQVGLHEASVERAMLELGKRGNQASKFTDTLLDSAKSDDRTIRQAILLALPKIAQVPCANCEAKLKAAIKAGEGKTTLSELNIETTMMKNYFGWAGGKTPSSTSSEDELPVSAEPKPIRKK